MQNSLESKKPQIKMNFSADNFLENALRKREEQNAIRKLVQNNQLVDFCSNDYLGFANSKELQENITHESQSQHFQLTGSTGSRLLAGNSQYVEQLEKKISAFHQAETGLIFNSGYDANVGLFSSLITKNDTVIYDELIHASVHDGIKLSGASAFLFKHNDLSHLEERLIIATGIIYVAVESIYSMDGDYAALKEIALLCEKYNANLIVDEAHATGITMNNGKGRVQELNLQTKVFARVHTFGKAMGCHGAIVLGNKLLRNFLINFSRSFIYTTALPIGSLIAINQAYEFLKRKQDLQIKLQELVNYFKISIANSSSIFLIASNSPIQCIVIPGNAEVKKIAGILQEAGFDIRPILNPTVPKGKERLRICIHYFNTTAQLKQLVDLIAKNL